MSNFIKTIVSNHLVLEYHLNKGEDRVRKSRVKGSLWIKNRYSGFRLQTTREIADILDNEIERLIGKPIGKQKDYKYWYIDEARVVERIIEFLARS